MWIRVRISAGCTLIVESIYRAPKVAAVNRNIELDPCICTAYPEALLPRRFGKSKTRMIVSSCLLKSSSEMWKKEERTVETDEVEKIRAYIDEHYLTLVSMEKVAEEFGYNYTYLSRMFKQKKISEEEYTKRLLSSKPEEEETTYEKRFEKLNKDHQMLRNTRKSRQSHKLGQKGPSR